MQPDRCEVIGECFERQPVVARREAQLAGGELLRCLDAGQFGARVVVQGRDASLV